MFSAQIAAEIEVTESQVGEALAFYDAHRQEIDTAIAAEHRIEPKAHGQTAASLGCRNRVA
jgi:hypothetical protein